MQATIAPGGPGSAASRTPEAPQSPPEAPRRTGTEGGVVETRETAAVGQAGAATGVTGLLGGDPAEDAAILAALMPSLDVAALVDRQGKVDREAMNKLFLELCDNLKSLALAGALGETELGLDLAMKMDQLKDQVFDLQNEIQHAVEELRKAEKNAETSKAVNVAMAWVGVVATALAAVMTVGAAAPVLGAAIAGTVFASVNASLQTASYAGAEKLDPRSDAYKAATTTFMALELVCCLGMTAMVSFSGPKLVKATTQAAAKGADDAAEGAARAAGRLADKPTPGGAAKAAGEAASDDVGFFKALSRRAAEEGDLAQAGQRYDYQKFAAFLDAFQVVTEGARSAVSIVSHQRTTDARDRLLGFQQQSKPIENSLEYVQRKRQAAGEHRNALQQAGTDLLNTQFDQIQSARDLGLTLAEWRRI